MCDHYARHGLTHDDQEQTKKLLLTGVFVTVPVIFAIKAWVAFFSELR
jgi:hypothetical protein